MVTSLSPLYAETEIMRKQQNRTGHCNSSRQEPEAFVYAVWHIFTWNPKEHCLYRTFTVMIESLRDNRKAKECVGLREVMGARLAAARRKRRLTLREVADEAGISISFLCDLENGRSSPSIETVAKLAHLYSVSTDYILGRTNERQPGCLDVALHRTDGYDKPLPPEAIASIEEFIELMRIKYARREQDKGGGKQT